MRSRLLILPFLLSSFLFACTPTNTPTPELQIVNVYATFAVQPWLANVYDCASSGTIINLSDSVEADLSIRLGEAEFLSLPTYQFGEEDILVVVSRESARQDQTLNETRELFAGGDSSSEQVWIYASGEDVQVVFEQVVMQGRSVTSFARLAVRPKQMSGAVAGDPQAVGFLPRHWMNENLREVYAIPSVPVLAITQDEPQGAIQEIIACLQK